MTTAAVFVALCSRIEQKQLSSDGEQLTLNQLLKISKS